MSSSNAFPWLIAFWYGQCVEMDHLCSCNCHNACWDLENALSSTSMTNGWNVTKTRSFESATYLYKRLFLNGWTHVPRNRFQEMEKLKLQAYACNGKLLFRPSYEQSPSPNIKQQVEHSVPPCVASTHAGSQVSRFAQMSLGCGPQVQLRSDVCIYRRRRCLRRLCAKGAGCVFRTCSYSMNTGDVDCEGVAICFAVRRVL